MQSETTGEGGVVEDLNLGKKEKENEKTERKAEQEQQPEDKAVQVRQRDRELLAHVAVMKYAAERHLQRLVFVTPVLAANRKRRTGEALAINVMRRRLLQLSRGKGALLRQLEYRGDDRVPRRAYCVTALGYNIARPLLKSAPPVPPGDKVGDQFLAHSLTLNDLYVELATAKKGLSVRAASLPFSWRSESLQLPWREFNVRRGENDERRLVPDGMLELLSAKTRVFIECEMGGHPILRQPNSENDSVMGKLLRYSKFVQLIGGKSHYALQFGDQWKPELLFLVRSASRADSVNKALAEWRSANPGHPLTVRAADLAGAVATFAPRLGLPSPPAKKLELESEEATLLASALEQTVALCKSVRHYLREHPEVQANGCPYPEYPEQLERALKVAARIRTETRK
jgi:hypothetical protein